MSPYSGLSRHNGGTLREGMAKPDKLWKDGEYIQTFPSIKEAAVSLGLLNATSEITNCCRGNIKSARGFVWAYIDNCNSGSVRNTDPGAYISVKINDVYEIRNSTFYGCSNLVNIEVPKVTKIGDLAFAECRKLAYIPNESKITYIGYSAFVNNSLITSPTLPKLSYLGFAAFSGCSNSDFTSFSNTVLLSLQGSTFRNCYNLEEVYLPNVKSIGGYEFAGCSKLSVLDID